MKLYTNVICLLFMIIGIGCSPNLLIKKDFPNNEIAICVNMNDSIPEIVKKNIDSVTNQFILDYNNGSNKYKLISCQNDSNRTLFLKMLSIRVTTPGQQAAGVVITVIGSITPFVMIAMNSPIYIWFGYLPRSYLGMNMELSNDISASKSKLLHKAFAGSNKYFGSYDEQKKLLLKGYYDRLKIEINLLEKNAK